MVPAEITLFDLGRVVLDWEPERLYRKIFDDPAQRDWFLANVCTMDWHTRHDAGASFADNAASLIARHPNYETEILAWGGRWMEMFDGYIEGTAALLEQLEAQNVPLYALSNMPAETWPWMQSHFPLLTLFRHTVVSGAIGLVKPDARIYAHTLEKMGGPAPETVLFIDDSARNIDAAKALGFQTHLFTDATELEAALRDAKLL